MSQFCRFKDLWIDIWLSVSLNQENSSRIELVRLRIPDHVVCEGFDIFDIDLICLYHVLDTGFVVIFWDQLLSEPEGLFEAKENTDELCT